MANWTYADIERKVRLITGRPDTSMLSSADIQDYVNKFYQFVLSKELKIFWGYTYYEFFTQPNVDQYAGPTTSFQTINSQAWCDGFPITWYLSPDLFYQDWPEQLNKQLIGTGDGIQTTFPFNISAYPVVAESVYVTDGTQTAQDDGAGGFLAPYSGSINYVTGVASITFPVAPASGTNIRVTSETYQSNRPQGILYFQSSPLSDSTQSVRDNKKVFVLRPVPDDVYLIKMQGIQVPKPLVNDTDVPFREDLGPLIAYGASLDIFSNYNQMDQYEQILVEYKRYKNVSMQDTYEEYLYQRAVPKF